MSQTRSCQESVARLPEIVLVGFESSHMARRRLASMAMSNRRVQDALAATPAVMHSPLAVLGEGGESGRALAVELEALAQDIASTPGAGGALLASFAEQARVLQLVVQASSRSPGAPLPADVLAAVQAAVSAGGPVGWGDGALAT